MKKKIFIILLLLFTFTLTGCFEKGPDNNKPDDKEEVSYVISSINGFDNFEINQERKSIFINVEKDIPVFAIYNIEVERGSVVGFYDDYALTKKLPQEIKLEEQNSFYIGISDDKTGKLDAWHIEIFKKVAPTFTKVVDLKVYFKKELSFKDDPREEDIISLIDNISLFLNNDTNIIVNFDEFINEYDGRMDIHYHNKTVIFKCNGKTVEYGFIKEIVYSDLEITFLNDLYFDSIPTLDDVYNNIIKLSYRANNELIEYTEIYAIKDLINNNGDLTITDNKIKVELFTMVKEYSFVVTLENTQLIITKNPDIRFNKTPTLEDIYIRFPNVHLTNPDLSVETIKTKDFINKGGEIIINDEESQITFLYKKYNLRVILEYRIDPSYVSGHIEIEYEQDENGNDLYFVCDKTPTLGDISLNIKTLTIYEENHKKVLRDPKNIMDYYNKGRLGFEVDPDNNELTFTYTGDVTPLSVKYVDISKEDFNVYSSETTFKNDKIFSDTLISFKEVTINDICDLISNIKFQYGEDSKTYIITKPELINTFVTKFATLDKEEFANHQCDYTFIINNTLYNFKYLLIKEEEISKYRFHYLYKEFPKELFEHIPLDDRFEFVVNAINFQLTDGTEVNTFIQDFPLFKDIIQYVYHENNPKDYFVIDSTVLDISKYDSTSDFTLLNNDEIQDNKINLYLTNPCFLLESFSLTDSIKERMKKVTYTYRHNDKNNEININLDIVKKQSKVNPVELTLGKNIVNINIFMFTFDYELIMYQKGEEKHVYDLTYNKNASYHISEEDPTLDDLLTHIEDFKLYYYDGTTAELTSNDLINEKEKYHLNFTTSNVKKEGYQENNITLDVDGFNEIININSILKSQLQNVQYDSNNEETIVEIDSKDNDFRINYDNYLDYITNDNKLIRYFTFDDPMDPSQRAMECEIYSGEQLKALLTNVERVYSRITASNVLEIYYYFTIFDQDFTVNYTIKTKDDIKTVEPVLDINFETNKDGKLVFQYNLSRKGLAALVNSITFIDEFNVKHIYNKQDSRERIESSMEYNVCFATDYVMINFVDFQKVIATYTIDYILNPTPEFIPASFDFKFDDRIYVDNENITLSTCKELLNRLILMDASGYSKEFVGNKKDEFIDKYCRVEKVDNVWYLVSNYPGLTTPKYELPIVNLDNNYYTIKEINIGTEYYPTNIYKKLTDKEILYTILHSFYYENMKEYGQKGTFNTKSIFDKFSIEKGTNSFKVLYNGKPIIMKSYINHRVIDEIKIIENQYDSINYTSDLYEKSIIIENISKDNDILQYNDECRISYKINSLPVKDSTIFGYSFDLNIPIDMLVKYGSVSFYDIKTVYKPNYYTVNIFGYEFKNNNAYFHHAVDNDKIRKIDQYGGITYAIDDVNNIDYKKYFFGYIQLYNNTRYDIEWVSVPRYNNLDKQWADIYNPVFEEISVTEYESNKGLYRHELKLTIGDFSTNIHIDLYHINKDSILNFAEIKTGTPFLDLSNYRYGKGFKITKDNIYDLIDSNVEMTVLYDVVDFYRVTKIVNAKEWLQANTEVMINEYNYGNIKTKYSINFLTKDGDNVYNYEYIVYNLVK